VKFQHFKGSTAGTMFGPIVLPDISALWHATWPHKKDIFTAQNLIAVGGKLDIDDEDIVPETPLKTKRDRDTIEPVFFHALPDSFHTELLGAFPLSGVLDLTPGDGALALSAYKKGLVYTGLVFSDAHKAHLAHHLEQSIWHAMSDDTDPLFEPRLVAALVHDTDVKPRGDANHQGKRPRTLEPADSRGDASRQKVQVATGSSQPGPELAHEHGSESENDPNFSDS
jgi:hypothetical protein